MTEKHEGGDGGGTSLPAAEVERALGDYAALQSALGLDGERRDAVGRFFQGKATEGELEAAGGLRFVYRMFVECAGRLQTHWCLSEDEERVAWHGEVERIRRRVRDGVNLLDDFRKSIGTGEFQLRRAAAYIFAENDAGRRVSLTAGANHYAEEVRREFAKFGDGYSSASSLATALNANAERLGLAPFIHKGRRGRPSRR